MAEPSVGTLTRRLYDRLPVLYRDADSDFTLLRYLSLAGDQAAEVETLVDRIGGSASELVDPATADVRWLPWLAQLVGVKLDLALSVADRRAAISTAATGWRAGTKESIRLAAQTALTGTRYVEVIDHYNGDEWTVGIRTRADETADQAEVVAAVLELGAKPAGVVLVTAFYTASWTVIETKYPSWTAVEGTGSWTALESTQP